MKSTLVFAAAVSVAYAQYFPGEPACAIPCLTSAITAAGCALSDIPCQCGPTQAAIAAAGAGCLLSKCNGTEVGQAQSAGLAVCSSLSAGILTIPATTGPSSATITSASSSVATLSSNGNTSVNATESVTVPGKTLSGTIVTPSTTASTSAPTSVTHNAAPSPTAAAKMMGGLLAGVLGVIVAL